MCDGGKKFAQIGYMATAQVNVSQTCTYNGLLCTFWQPKAAFYFIPSARGTVFSSHEFEILVSQETWQMKNFLLTDKVWQLLNECYSVAPDRLKDETSKVIIWRVAKKLDHVTGIALKLFQLIRESLKGSELQVFDLHEMFCETVLDQKPAHDFPAVARPPEQQTHTKLTVEELRNANGQKPMPNNSPNNSPSYCWHGNEEVNGYKTICTNLARRSVHKSVIQDDQTSHHSETIGKNHQNVESEELSSRSTARTKVHFAHQLTASKKLNDAMNLPHLTSNETFNEITSDYLYRYKDIDRQLLFSSETRQLTETRRFYETKEFPLSCCPAMKPTVKSTRDGLVTANMKPFTWKLSQFGKKRNTTNSSSFNSESTQNPTEPACHVNRCLSPKRALSISSVGEDASVLSHDASDGRVPSSRVNTTRRPTHPRFRLPQSKTTANSRVAELQQSQQIPSSINPVHNCKKIKKTESERESENSLRNDKRKLNLCCAKLKELHEKRRLSKASLSKTRMNQANYTPQLIIADCLKQQTFKNLCNVSSSEQESRYHTNSLIQQPCVNDNIYCCVFDHSRKGACNDSRSLSKNIKNELSSLWDFVRLSEARKKKKLGEFHKKRDKLVADCEMRRLELSRLQKSQGYLISPHTDEDTCSSDTSELPRTSSESLAVLYTNMNEKLIQASNLLEQHYDRSLDELLTLEKHLIYQQMWKRIQVCHVCKKVGMLSACANCLSVFYCGKSCQLRDWLTTHKQDCKPMEENVHN